MSKAEKLIETAIKESSLAEASGDVELHFSSKTFDRYCDWKVGGDKGYRGDQLMDKLRGGGADDYFDDDDDDELYLPTQQYRALEKIERNGITILVDARGRMTVKV